MAFLYQCRVACTIHVNRWTLIKQMQTQTLKQTDNVIQHCIHIKVVPINGEAEETNRQTKRERMKQQTIQVVAVMFCRFSFLLSHIS